MIFLYCAGYVVFATIGCILALRNPDHDTHDMIMFSFLACMLAMAWPIFAIPSLAWLINKGILPND